MTTEDATNYLLKWMEGMKAERRNNPEAFQVERESQPPGLYIGGIRFNEGDSIVTDNHGLPHIHRKGYFE